MKFPYVKVPTADPRRKWIARPIIPIKIFGPKGSVTIDALIDSGADRSLFNIEIASEIGLDLKRCPVEKFSGIEAGVLLARIYKIPVQILGMDEKIEIPVGFTESKGVVAILGQEGFFDAYRVKFERNRGIIEITPL